MGVDSQYRTHARVLDSRHSRPMLPGTTVPDMSQPAGDQVQSGPWRSSARSVGWCLGSTGSAMADVPYTRRPPLVKQLVAHVNGRLYAKHAVSALTIGVPGGCVNCVVLEGRVSPTLHLAVALGLSPSPSSPPYAPRA